MDMTIGKLAEAADVGVETVRFYQRRGLLHTPSRAGGIRRYGDEDLRKLRFVRMAQRAGFTLDEIGELLALDAGHDRERARELARQRLRRLDDHVAELEAARAYLGRLTRRCASTHMGPCPILASFER